MVLQYQIPDAYRKEDSVERRGNSVFISARRLTRHDGVPLETVDFRLVIFIVKSAVCILSCVFS
jgi:hypothetical protein